VVLVAIGLCAFAARPDAYSEPEQLTHQEL
jgi:hypothetical protein